MFSYFFKLVILKSASYSDHCSVDPSVHSSIILLIMDVELLGCIFKSSCFHHIRHCPGFICHLSIDEFISLDFGFVLLIFYILIAFISSL